MSRPTAASWPWSEILMSERRPLLPPRFQPGWAKVVTGADEGVYGWIALNYATGHLAVNPVLAAVGLPPGGRGAPVRLQANSGGAPGTTLFATTSIPPWASSVESSAFCARQLHARLGAVVATAAERWVSTFVPQACGSARMATHDLCFIRSIRGVPLQPARRCRGWGLACLLKAAIIGSDPCASMSTNSLLLLQPARRCRRWGAGPGRLAPWQFNCAKSLCSINRTCCHRSRRGAADSGGAGPGRLLAGILIMPQTSVQYQSHLFPPQPAWRCRRWGRWTWVAPRWRSPSCRRPTPPSPTPRTKVLHRMTPGATTCQCSCRNSRLPASGTAA